MHTHWQEGVTSVVSPPLLAAPLPWHAQKSTTLKIHGLNDLNGLRHPSSYFPADSGPSTSS